MQKKLGKYLNNYLGIEFYFLLFKNTEAQVLVATISELVSQ